MRFELMKWLGYFVTESSEHSAEYSPYFIPHGPLHSAKYNVPIDEYLHRCDCSVDQFEKLKAMSRTDSPIDVRRSPEYGSTIIHSMVSGTPGVVYGNMPNRGTIANLADDAIAEAPTVVDGAGLRFTPVGELPPQLVGYIQPHVTQHELFIRAAMEGRRDHIYQAAMFDPLTAATMPLDKIVEMCDELIAAHGTIGQGGFLPDLDAKKTLVSQSGVAFPKVDAHALREQWCRKRKRELGEHIKAWHVIGPFPAGNENRRGLELVTALEEAFAAGGHGAVDLRMAHRADGKSLTWKPASADERGFVNLDVAAGKMEWAVAYGYAEIRSEIARDVVLRMGSDDGIKVWVNGVLVHWHEVGRSYRPDSDFAPARLNAGINRIFVKIDNYTAGWGFGVAVPGRD